MAEPKPKQCFIQVHFSEQIINAADPPLTLLFKTTALRSKLTVREAVVTVSRGSGIGDLVGDGVAFGFFDRNHAQKEIAPAPHPIGISPSKSMSSLLLLKPPPPSYEDLDGMIYITRDGAAAMPAVWYDYRDPAKPEARAMLTILYCHDYDEDLGTARKWARAASTLLRCEALAYEYPGWGRNDGEPTQSLVNESALAALAFLAMHRSSPPGRVVVVGRGQGAAPAIHAANALCCGVDPRAAWPNLSWYRSASGVLRPEFARGGGAAGAGAAAPPLTSPRANLAGPAGLMLIAPEGDWAALERKALRVTCATLTLANGPHTMDQRRLGGVFGGAAKEIADVTLGAHVEIRADQLVAMRRFQAALVPRGAETMFGGMSPVLPLEGPVGLWLARHGLERLGEALLCAGLSELDSLRARGTDAALAAAGVPPERRRSLLLLAGVDPAALVPDAAAAEPTPSPRSQPSAPAVAISPPGQTEFKCVERRIKDGRVRWRVVSPGGRERGRWMALDDLVRAERGGDGGELEAALTFEAAQLAASGAAERKKDKTRLREATATPKGADASSERSAEKSAERSAEKSAEDVRADKRRSVQHTGPKIGEARQRASAFELDLRRVKRHKEREEKGKITPKAPLGVSAADAPTPLSPTSKSRSQVDDLHSKLADRETSAPFTARVEAATAPAGAAPGSSAAAPTLPKLADGAAAVPAARRGGSEELLLHDFIRTVVADADAGFITAQLQLLFREGVFSMAALEAAVRDPARWPAVSSVLAQPLRTALEIPPPPQSPHAASAPDSAPQPKAPEPTDAVRNPASPRKKDAAAAKPDEPKAAPAAVAASPGKAKVLPATVVTAISSPRRDSGTFNAVADIGDIMLGGLDASTTDLVLNK